MHLFDWFYRQPVTEGEMDEAFESAEIADQRIASDNGLIGIVLNGGLAEHSAVPDLTVDIDCPMIAYDQQGQRIAITGTGGVEVVDVSVDSNAVSTSVVGGANSKWVSVFARFDRALSTPRTDGNSAIVQFDIDESFEIIVMQGAEGVAPTRPALLGDALLIGDILRTFGQTQILNADIDETRKQRAFVLSTSDFDVSAGTAEEAMQAVLQELQNHVDNVGVAHPADAIEYDPTTLPIPAGWTEVAGSSNVQAAIDGIVEDLAQSDGGARIGTAISATWADASTVAATNVDLVLEEIVTDLAGTGGAARVGAAAFGNLAAGTVRSQLNELDNEKGGLALANVWTNTNDFDAAVTIGAAFTHDAGIATFTGTQVDFEVTATFSGPMNFDDLDAGSDAFSSANTRWQFAANQIAHAGGGGSDNIFTLFTPSTAGEFGIIELYAVGCRDNDEDLRRAAHYVVSYGRPTSGTTTTTAFVNDEADQGGGIDVTNYQITVTANAIIFRAVNVTAAVTNNYILAWRRISAAGDQ